ncbi:MAG: hypothetical protein EXS14_06880 [Planctomycetes bacterium]|nr:hypothetical protein [Planctomycetota bacterium]
MTAGCDTVSSYLAAFLDLGPKDSMDLEAISLHAGECASCRERLTQFFHSVELPESTYLRETIDELALAVFNLARALIRDEPGTSETENVRITEEGGGSAAENLSASDGLLGDAEDYTGTSKVGGVDLEEVRSELAAAANRHERRVELAMALFRRITTLACRYHDKAWNWLGVLHYQREELDAAEAAFLKVLTDASGARDSRAFAHCNLAYVFKHRGDLDRAVRSAERSIVLSEEDGRDPYFGRFAALYMRLLRFAPGDETKAAAHADAILVSSGGRTRLLQDLGLPSNAPVLETVRKSSLAKSLGLSA